MIIGHGIGGVRDLPVPAYLFFYGAAIVLAVSFVALAALWRRPVLEARASGRTLPGWLERVLLSPALRIVAGSASIFVFGFLWLGALIGKSSSGVNFTPTFVYVFFWVGMALAVVLLGNIWSVLSPWQAVAEATGWAARRLGLRGTPPFAYPMELGRWPAVLLLLAFAAIELAYVEPANPRVLALAIAIYSTLTWLGAAAYGCEAWFRNGDGFSVYFALLARISVLARRDDGRLIVRTPLSGLSVRDPTPGTTAFVAVMLGSTFFDGFSRASIWSDRYYQVQVNLLDRPSLADLAGVLMGIGGLLVAIAFIAAVFHAAVRGTELIAARRPLAQDFVDSLIPIALVYVIAHYFSLLVLQGEVGVRMLSDPWGRGWDLFGTRSFQPDFTILTPNTIWYVQVAALITGHVCGLAVAHDRAVGLFRTPRTAMWSQYPMLVLMVLYTVGGLWVLSQG